MLPIVPPRNFEARPTCRPIPRPTRRRPCASDPHPRQATARRVRTLRMQSNRLDTPRPSTITFRRIPRAGQPVPTRATPAPYPPRRRADPIPVSHDKVAPTGGSSRVRRLRGALRPMVPRLQPRQPAPSHPVQRPSPPLLHRREPRRVPEHPQLLALARWQACAIHSAPLQRGFSPKRRRASHPARRRFRRRLPEASRPRCDNATASSLCV